MTASLRRWRWRGAVIPLAIFAAYAAGAALAPTATASLTAKEGPLEHVSHLVLAAAAIGWTRGAIWARGGRRRASAQRGAVALWLWIVLGEELQWGAVLGLDALADRLVAWSGRADFHNAWSGHSYVLFGLPAAVLLAAGLHAIVRRRTAVTVDAADTIGLSVVAVGAAVGIVLPPPHEAQLDEVSELALYAVLAAAAWRSRAELAGDQADISKPTKQRLSPPSLGE